MGTLGLLLAISSAVLNTGSTLRNGCDSDAETVAVLPAGAAVEVRSSISGGAGTCYKVAASLDGRQVTGYVPAKAVGNSEAFEQARRGARGFGVSEPVPAPAPVAAKVPGSNAASRAGDRIQSLLQSNEPAEALTLAEQELKKSPKDPGLLALAGLASYRADNLDRAILYWNDSLAVQPNPQVEQLLARARREMAADGGSERTIGARVVIRYERGTVSPQLAQSMLATLDQEYSRISAALGCRAAEKVTAVVQSREAYMRSTSAAEWSGAMYDGRIHVPVSPTTRIDARTRQVLAHELVHACLSELGRWPAWLQEGLAQKYSGETLPPAVFTRLEDVLRSGKLPRLNQMGQSFARLSAANAQIAYGVAYVAASKLLELTATTGIGNVLRNPSEFERLTEEVERCLGADGTH
ncbi:MAG: hypothetical protein SFV51_20620 [Bryobacteraceae bacterium]|nr:hypothetical protein [Bryobacteraceae bacterium]